MTGAEELTVVVLTRARLNVLARALESLAKQQDATFHVVVIVDDCPTTAELLRCNQPRGAAILSFRYEVVRRADGARSGPKQVAFLRKFAVESLNTDWISFLDDDNAVTPRHYNSLLRAATAASAPAAHSWRSLWGTDGQPFTLTGQHPWCRDPGRARELYLQYAAAGIYQYGSHIVRDQVVPYRRDYSMVDMSEWVFRASFLRQYPFTSQYSAVDWLEARSEDSKLLDEIVAAGIPIPSTRAATLRYFLGGYSNSTEIEGGRRAEWEI